MDGGVNRPADTVACYPVDRRSEGADADDGAADGCLGLNVSMKRDTTEVFGESGGRDGIDLRTGVGKTGELDACGRAAARRNGDGNHVVGGYRCYSRNGRGGVNGFDAGFSSSFSLRRALAYLREVILATAFRTHLAVGWALRRCVTSSGATVPATS